MTKEVVPESEINDPIVADPIRLVGTHDYRDGILTLKLNQPVNDIWDACFRKRATRFSGNMSSAFVSFHRDELSIRVTEHSLQEGLRFVKDYIPLANEEYAALIKREHTQAVEQRRTALRNKIAQEEARQRFLQKVNI
jgi:hypothetical protein